MSVGFLQVDEPDGGSGLELIRSAFTHIHTYTYSARMARHDEFTVSTNPLDDIVGRDTKSLGFWQCQFAFLDLFHLEASLRAVLRWNEGCA